MQKDSSRQGRGAGISPVTHRLSTACIEMYMAGTPKLSKNISAALALRSHTQHRRQIEHAMCRQCTCRCAAAQTTGTQDTQKIRNGTCHVALQAT